MFGDIIFLLFYFFVGMVTSVVVGTVGSQDALNYPRPVNKSCNGMPIYGGKKDSQNQQITYQIVSSLVISFIILLGWRVYFTENLWLTFFGGVIFSSLITWIFHSKKTIWVGLNNWFSKH